MKNKFSVLLALLLLAFSAQAQIIEDKAQFSDTKRGSAIFELEAGEHIYTYEPSDGWYKARKKVFLKPADVSDNRLSAGANFYDEDGRKIGKALEAIKLYEVDTLEAFRSNPQIIAVVQGYVFETKIEELSVPEEKIETILALKNRTDQKREFDALWEMNKAETRDFDDLSASVIYEYDKGTAEEQDFRLIMVFRGSSPYALITNDHSVELEKVKEVWEEGSFKIYYFYKASSSQKALVEEMIYTFLAL